MVEETTKRHHSFLSPREDFECPPMRKVRFVAVSLSKDLECKGKKFLRFRDKNGDIFAHCCKEHQGNMPNSLF
ncbi:hypothetical protein GMAR_ORF1 [Golden Marseillevirus]|uniref:hypothetical protein n=1 Tax=Golden Marseillevirus TaxID=1720526 RepID=UPI000877A9C4|nr:hypothetical protein GMAR_ORF1 [Golden Marseillevirus]ALX27376.1 hypothetical protein GMAR_ORF1 [Golden Marseillevirus]